MQLIRKNYLLLLVTFCAIFAVVISVWGVRGLNHFVLYNCVPDAEASQWQNCLSHNNFASFLIPIADSVGLWLPLILGLYFGQRFAKGQRVWWNYFGWTMLATLLIIVGLSISEIVRFRPWATIPGPGGVLINKFTLDAVYATPFAVVSFIVATLGLVIRTVTSSRLWKNFRVVKNGTPVT